ncbi:MAG: hypothetical protein JWM27_2171 [Gemmatimonadetes bacterium]|nr:hypothetical protein [Gemmatimonadota bacterium]
MPQPAPAIANRRLAARFAAIRLMILLPVLAVGVVGWLRLRKGGVIVDVPGSRPLLYVFLAAAALAAAAVALLFVRWRRETGGAERNRLSILAWAACEMPGLLGGVYYFISTDARPYFGGLFLLLFSFMLFPLPGRR